MVPGMSCCPCCHQARLESAVEALGHQQVALFHQILERLKTIMITATDLAAQFDIATTAEAQHSAAVSAKIDAQNTAIAAVQTELQSLFDRLVAAGTPQAVLDSLQASLAKLGGSSTALATAVDVLDAQAVRLTAMASDPASPSPAPVPPVA